MAVLVRQTRENKPFHVRANHLGQEKDVKLKWVNKNFTLQSGLNLKVNLLTWLLIKGHVNPKMQLYFVF